MQFSEFKTNKEGFIPVIVQDYRSKSVLMLAYMNEEAYLKSKESGYTHFYSRSRKTLWKKGESSGNLQKIRSLFYDCDRDTLLAIVEQTGVACHTGSYSCFSQNEISLFKNQFDLFDLEKIIIDRRNNPKEGSYTNYLFSKGIDKILKKIGEEASEVIIASKNNKEETIYEASDLLYHLLVLLNEKEIPLDSIYRELKSRHKK